MKPSKIFQIIFLLLILECITVHAFPLIPQKSSDSQCLKQDFGRRYGGLGVNIMENRISTTIELRKKYNIAPVSMSNKQISTAELSENAPSQQNLLNSLRGNMNDHDKDIRDITLPALVGALIDPAMSLIDSAYAGRLGAISLAALGPCTSIFHFSFNTFRALTFTTTALVSKSVACQRKDQAGQVGTQSLVLACFLGIVTSSLLVTFGTQFLYVMGVGVGSPLLPQALPYLKVRALVAPVVLCIMAMEGIFRGHGDTRTPLVAAGVAALINFSLDPILMFKANMGVAGAAAATCIAECFAAAIYVCFLFKRKDQFSLGFRSPTAEDVPYQVNEKVLKKSFKYSSMMKKFKTTVKAIGSSLASGLPLMKMILGANSSMFIRSTSVMATWAYATATATRLGTSHVAAHQVLLSLWLFLALMVEAPGVAAQVLAGRYHSVGKKKQLRTLLGRLVKVVSTCGMIVGAVLLVLKPFLPGLFASDPSVLENCHKLLNILVCQQPIVGVTLVMESFLVGCGQFSYLAWATVVSTIATTLGITAVGRRWIGTGHIVEIWHCLTLLFVFRLIAMVLRFLDDEHGPLADTPDEESLQIWQKSGVQENRSTDDTCELDEMI